MKKSPNINKCKERNIFLFQIPLLTFTYLIPGMLLMEKNMQVFKCEYDLPQGKINHNVHVDWDDKGNLHITEQDLGDGVKQIWGTDEYEYFMMIHQKHVKIYSMLLLERVYL